jgi:hypothetical protein
LQPRQGRQQNLKIKLLLLALDSVLDSVVAVEVVGVTVEGVLAVEVVVVREVDQKDKNQNSNKR